MMTCLLVSALYAICRGPEECEKSYIAGATTLNLWRDIARVNELSLIYWSGDFPMTRSGAVMFQIGACGVGACGS